METHYASTSISTPPAHLHRRARGRCYGGAEHLAHAALPAAAARRGPGLLDAESPAQIALPTPGQSLLKTPSDNRQPVITSGCAFGRYYHEEP
ncbi:hypothetical protein [Pseudomonas luteola]|uniref:hypothetical protein n=1 Tax=Pseudomonas luteola TaxID=47886 RepID=UPI00163A8266|nr:hypothetical protein [Pseudomonas luteola]